METDGRGLGGFKVQNPMIGFLAIRHIVRSMSCGFDTEDWEGCQG